MVYTLYMYMYMIIHVHVLVHEWSWTFDFIVNSQQVTHTHTHHHHTEYSESHRWYVQIICIRYKIFSLRSKNYMNSFMMVLLQYTTPWLTLIGTWDRRRGCRSPLADPSWYCCNERDHHRWTVSAWSSSTAAQYGIHVWHDKVLVAGKPTTFSVSKFHSCTACTHK